MLLFIFRILSVSPMCYSFKKAHQIFLVRRNNEINIDENTRLSDNAFFETYVEEKPKLMTNKELLNLYNSKAKLYRQQRLIKSVLDDYIKNSASKHISNQALHDVKDMYEFCRKYKRYLRIKRILPLSVIAFFTTDKLSKMAYAAAIDSISVYLSLFGIIGISLPAFYFFHMGYYYAPDKLKPICNFFHYTAGMPF